MSNWNLTALQEYALLLQLRKERATRATSLLSVYSPARSLLPINAGGNTTLLPAAQATDPIRALLAEAARVSTVSPTSSLGTAASPPATPTEANPPVRQKRQLNFATKTETKRRRVAPKNPVKPLKAKDCFPLPSTTFKKTTKGLPLASFQSKWKRLDQNVRPASGAFPTKSQRDEFLREIFVRSLGKSI